MKQLLKKLSLSLSALLLLFTLTPAPTHAAFPGQNGQIAWSDYLVGIENETVTLPLSRMKFDGTSQQQILPDGFWFAPRYSADGNKIVVSGSATLTGDGIYFRIHTLNPDGTNLQNVTNYNPADHPEREDYNETFASFHPNNTKLVYDTRWEEDLGDGSERVWAISTVNTDGTNQQELNPATPDTCDVYPVYSPDGSKIAFYRGDKVNNTSGIYVMDADGTNINELVELSATEAVCEGDIGFALSPTEFAGKISTNFDWSPDGQRIVYATYESVTDDNDEEVSITSRIQTTTLFGNVQTVYEETFDSNIFNGEPPYPEGDYRLFNHITPQYTPDGQIIFKRITMRTVINSEGLPADQTFQVSIMRMNADGSNIVTITEIPELSLMSLGEQALYEMYYYLLPSVQPITSQTLNWGLGTDSSDGTGQPDTPSATALAATGRASTPVIAAALALTTASALAIALRRKLHTKIF